jgi:hypothetical protein
MSIVVWYFLLGWVGFGVVLVVAATFIPDPHPGPLPGERGRTSCYLGKGAICRSPFGAIFGGEMVGIALWCWGFGLFDGCLGGFIVFESL